MSKLLTYTVPNRLSYLHSELLAAGITPESVTGKPDQTECYITVADSQSKAAVDTVVAAHNPAAIDAALSQTATADTAERTQAQQALSALNTYIGLTSPTNAQVAQEVLLLSKIAKYLVRKVI